jgi:hypothetical protein
MKIWMKWKRDENHLISKRIRHFYKIKIEALHKSNDRYYNSIYHSSNNANMALSMRV